MNIHGGLLQSQSQLICDVVHVWYIYNDAGVLLYNDLWVAFFTFTYHTAGFISEVIIFTNYNKQGVTSSQILTLKQFLIS